MYHKEYAAIYDTIGQSAFSEAMAMQVLDRIGADRWGNAPYHGRRVLDLGCGTGTAALVFAAAGCAVLGVDRSVAMLSQARRKAESQGLPVSWLRADMRYLLGMPRQRMVGQYVYASGKPDGLTLHAFDLITCFGGLNYLLEEDDLRQVCAVAAALLQPGGFCVFDLWTEMELDVWSTNDRIVYSDSDYLAYQRLDYAPQTRRGGRRIGWFVREDERWWHGTEFHTERYWHGDELGAALQRVQPSFEVVDHVTAANVPAGNTFPRDVYYLCPAAHKSGSGGRPPRTSCK